MEMKCFQIFFSNMSLGKIYQITAFPSKFHLTTKTFPLLSLDSCQKTRAYPKTFMPYEEFLSKQSLKIMV